MFQLSRRPLTCLLVCGSALALSSALLGACSGTEADGDPEFDGIEGYGGPQNPGANNSGANNTPGQPTGQNTGSTNTGSTNTGSTGNGSTGTNTSPTPNTNPANPTTPNTEANPSPTPINSGTNTGTNAGTNGGNNGGAMAPGAGGAGSGMGTTPPPNNGSNPTPPVTPVPPVTPTPPVVTPSAPDIPCPAGATFCFGFESDTLPAGAGYQSQPTTPLQFDTTVKHSGNRSLKVVSAGSFNMREVIAPIPGQSFWVRLFIQTSNVFGDNDHDSLFVASTANPSQDNNDEHGPEFSEQGNQIILNADDNPLASANGPGFPQAPGPTLSANTWHCEEAFYDGATGDVQIFSNGDPIIDAPGFKRVTFQTFRFGYIGFNTVRTVWFDDVVVSPNRVNCN